MTVLKDSFYLVVFKIIYSVSYFYINISLANLLSVGEYGIFVYMLAVISILCVISSFGLEKLNTRFVQIYFSERNLMLVKGLIRSSRIITLVISIFVGCLFFIATKSSLPSLLIIPKSLVFVIICLIIIDSLLKTHKGVLVGSNQVIRSGLPELIVRPLLFSLVLSVFIFIEHDQTELELFFNWYLLVSVISLAFSFLLVHGISKTHFSEVIRNQYDIQNWVRQAFPLFLAEGIFVISTNVDLLMVGGMMNEVETGTYAVANRGASVVAFVLGSLTIAMSPRIALYYKEGRTQELQNMVTLLSRIMFAIAALFVIIFSLYGREIISIFGAGYSKAYYSLLILSYAQMLNAAAGAVGIILMMTGHGQRVVLWVGISILINIFLNNYLIPIYGIEGASVATSISLVFWNIVLLAEVIGKLGVEPSVIGMRLNGAK